MMLFWDTEFQKPSMEAGVMIQPVLSFLTSALNLTPERGREVGGSN